MISDSDRFLKAADQIRFNGKELRNKYLHVEELAEKCGKSVDKINESLSELGYQEFIKEPSEEYVKAHLDEIIYSVTLACSWQPTMYAYNFFAIEGSKVIWHVKILDILQKYYTSRKKLIFLMGNIGTGKTRFAINYPEDSVRISMDDIITSIDGVYKSHRCKIYNEIEEVMLRKAIELEENVIIDRTHVNETVRCKSFDKLEDADLENYTTILINFGIGNQESLNRRIAEPRGITGAEWTTVYCKLSSLFKTPDEEELKKYDIYIEVDPTNTCEETMNMIIKKLNE